MRKPSPFKRRGRLVIVGSRLTSQTAASRMIQRIIVRTSRFDSSLVRQAMGAMAGRVLMGTAVKRRAYVSRPAFRSGFMSLRQLAHHELFHTFPVLGLSEIGAHFYGGFMFRKGCCSLRRGIHDVLFLSQCRPARFWVEVFIALGSILCMHLFS